MNTYARTERHKRTLKSPTLDYNRNETNEQKKTNRIQMYSSLFEDFIILFFFYFEILNQTIAK